MQHQKQPEIVVLAPVSAKTWCCLASFFASLSLLFLFLFLSLLLLRMFCRGSLSSLSLAQAIGFGLQPALSGLSACSPSAGFGLQPAMDFVVLDKNSLAAMWREGPWPKASMIISWCTFFSHYCRCCSYTSLQLLFLLLFHDLVHFLSLATAKGLAFSRPCPRIFGPQPCRP